MRGVFVTGTDTGVGKTWVGQQIVGALRAQGLRVRVRKPVETGCEPSATGLLPGDAQALRTAAGAWEPLDVVCPYRFRAALAPDQAARLEQQALTLDALREACQGMASPDDFLWVEGAGGFYSPIAEDGLNADLAARLGLPILLVIANRLGCINHALLTLEAIKGRGLDVAALVLNAPTGSHDHTAANNPPALRRWSRQTIHVFHHAAQELRGENATVAAGIVQTLLK